MTTLDEKQQKIKENNIDMHKHKYIDECSSYEIHIFKHCLFTKNTLAAFQSYEITKSTWTREEFDRKLNKAVSWSCMVIVHTLPMVIYVIISWDTHATKAFQQLKTQKFHKFLVNISREKM